MLKLKIVEKWAIREKTMDVDNTTVARLAFNYRDIQVFDNLEAAKKEHDNLFLFRIFQIHNYELALDECYLTLAEAKEKMVEIENESMEEEEVFEYLEEIGYNIRYDDGSFNTYVAIEMAVNERFRYHEILDRWFK
ncbi:hypothetical protein [Ureibacillus sp. GCM10028918]|uniref:hypothetical protein n=1 Tax=Ureibacillus sp. GCM10028918 TaxID=3273429 RepID=UPI00361ED7F2